MLYEGIKGVPDFTCDEYEEKKRKYVLLIPIINEGNRIHKELMRAKKYGVSKFVDIVICDAGSTDGCTDEKKLRHLEVNTLLVKKGPGKQGAQLRMGFWWAKQRGYDGILTIDGNNKDSIEDVTKMIAKLQEGYDLVQGSRFIRGGRAINTPFVRWLSVNLIHAPIISITARQRFTDTTNNFRAYSARYLFSERVQVFRDIFMTYELLAYLSVRATQIGMRACEVPVTRAYPKKGKVPTKILFFKGNSDLMKILFANLLGKYNPKESV
jgi:dolichyl-phosphate beta-D-mannosyltransferase